MDATLRQQHEFFMRLALGEAEKGLGRTSPNPAVGAIIVNQGKVVGRGYHKKAGTPHAEVNAIADAGEAARGGTIYVTLEPCNHTGRTPPCTQAILKAGLARVVIGTMDPNPRVVGGGAEFLQGQGIEVHRNILEVECRDLIRFFVKHSGTGIPWVIMKAGLSLDGRMTLRRGEGTAITGSQSRQAVHRLRDRVDAILVGVGTAVIDNPSLTTRLEDKPDARDPLRIVLDSQLRLPADAHMLIQTSLAPTWIVCGEAASKDRERELARAGAVVHRLATTPNGSLDLTSLLTFLGEQQILSLLVEGGATVHGAFWGQRLVDELRLYYAPIIIGEQGLPLVSGYSLQDRGKTPALTNIFLEKLGDDFFFHANVTKNP
ncbi:bifunctional diaminohydroxyphosphoribosylaminopyrimidine deaminase/5-amino-6-(5-phosphoribosylamino)uracil reductase RibD [Desulfobulbus propionicus]|jgi:diaminohydroxyphosphoribosylaminopyrimidine deaminase/5-amino-6-(5-phosphoribosylamino)uracil reductase